MLEREAPKRRKGRALTALAVTGAIAAGPTMLATAVSANASEAHKPGVIQLDSIPRPQGLALNLESGTLNVPPTVQRVSTPTVVTSDMNAYAVENGDTMNTVADAFLGGALPTDPTSEQVKVSRAVLEAANPQVADRNLIFANRTILNILDDGVSHTIAEAAEGRGDTHLVTAVDEVKHAQTLDDRREEAVDVLTTLGITPVRAEDSPPSLDVQPIADVVITNPEVDAAVSSGVLQTRTLAEKGDNLWDNTETVLKEGLGHDPSNAEVNPINRVEQVVNTTINPHINFKTMPVDAEYIGMSDPAASVIGTIASVDSEAIEESSLPQKVKDGIKNIQELNHQSASDGVTSADMLATKIILSMKPGMLSQTVKDQIIHIYQESDTARKNEQVLALLSDPVVNEALFGDTTPPVGGQGTVPGGSETPVISPPGSLDSGEPADVGTVATIGSAVLGTVLLGAGGIALYRRRQKSLEAQNKIIPAEQRTPEALKHAFTQIKDNPLTEEEMQNPSNIGPNGHPINTFTTRYLDEIKRMYELFGYDDTKIDPLMIALQEEQKKTASKRGDIKGYQFTHKTTVIDPVSNDRTNVQESGVLVVARSNRKKK